MFSPKFSYDNFVDLVDVVEVIDAVDDAVDAVEEGTNFCMFNNEDENKIKMKI